MTERVFKGLTAVFLAMEAVLYAAFLTLDLTGRGGAAIPIKYGGILLCLGFAALCALGLTLFVGCDACVGLFNALPAHSPLYPAVSVGMWLFYLPSQVLIALSAKEEFP